MTTPGSLRFLASLLLLLAVSATIGLGCTGEKEVEFDRTAWREWECCSDTSRLYAARSITAQLIGMHSQEVVALLGPSEYSSLELSQMGICEECLVYSLGVEPGLIRVDSNHLIVILKGDLVIRAYIL